MTTGTCKHCGCTEQRACGGGCAWVDESRTLCSACLHLASDEELLAGTLSDHRRSREAEIPLALSTVELTALVGLLQLAMRHPEIEDAGIRQLGQAFVDDVETCFLNTGLRSLAELVRRGNLPDHDQPLEPEHKIIIP